MSITGACRGCMRATRASRLRSLFGQDPESCLINQLYGILTSIRADHGDGLPSRLCTECWQLFANMGQFRDMCLASDREYRNRIQQGSSEDNNASTTTRREVVKSIEPNNDDEVSPINLDEMFEYTEHSSSDDDPPAASMDDAADIGEVKKAAAPSSSNNHHHRPECDLCGLTFHSKHLIESHMRKCHIAPAPNCIDCAATFTTWAALHAHRVSADHFGASAKHLAQSRQSAQQAAHEKYKNMPANFVCEQCGRAFKTSAMLVDHRVTHQDPDTFEHQCDLCAKRFGRKSSLADHMKRHMNIRQFVCTLCSAPFVSQGELRRHMTHHNAEPTVPCPRCDRKFQSRHNLLGHIRRIHDVHKPFGCHLCDQHFSCTWLRRAHLRKIHRVKGQSRKLYIEQPVIQDQENNG